MGNRYSGVICGGNVCPKAGQGGDNEIFDDTSTCDPAGAVFPETLEDLSEVDRLLLTFSSSTNLAAVKWLFVLGANVDACDANGTTCLHAACRSGSSQIVQEFVRRDLPLNATDVAGWTALHVALFMGRRAVAMRLMQGGAGLSPRNLKGLAPSDLCSDVWLREAISSCMAHRGCNGEDAPWQFGSESDLCEDVQAAARLRFEPFFVPRSAALKDSGGPRLLDIGTEIFNQRPGQGLAFLVATGTVKDFPVELGAFMLENRVSLTQVGEFLGENFSLSQTLRLEYVNSMRLVGTGVVTCLSRVFKRFHVPSDLHKINRLVDGIAQIWWRQHEQIKDSLEAQLEDKREAEKSVEVGGFRLLAQLSGYDTLHQLMLSTVLLHWNLYAPIPQSRRISLEAWLDMNAHLSETGPEDEAVDASSMKHTLMLIYGLISHSFFPQMQLWSSRAPGGSGIHHPSDGGAGKPSAKESLDEPKNGPREEVTRVDPTVEGWALLVGGSFPTFGSSSGTVTYRHVRSILSEASSTRGLASPVTSRSSRVCMDAPPPDRDAVSAGLPPSVTYRHPGLGGNGQALGECAGIPSTSPSGHDKVWLSLREDLLFLASKPSSWAPYAFLHLQDVVVQGVDRSALTLTLAMRSPRLPEIGEGRAEGGVGIVEGLAQLLEARQMQLVFLLTDGRWQVLDIPFMQVQVPDLQQLEKWKACLEEVSSQGKSYHAAVSREPTLAEREAQSLMQPTDNSRFI